MIKNILGCDVGLVSECEIGQNDRPDKRRSRVVNIATVFSCWIKHIQFPKSIIQRKSKAVRGLLDINRQVALHSGAPICERSFQVNARVTILPTNGSPQFCVYLALIRQACLGISLEYTQQPLRREQGQRASEWSTEQVDDSLREGVVSITWRERHLRSLKGGFHRFYSFQIHNSVSLLSTWAGSVHLYENNVILIRWPAPWHFCTCHLKAVTPSPVIKQRCGAIAASGT